MRIVQLPIQGAALRQRAHEVRYRAHEALQRFSRRALEENKLLSRGAVFTPYLNPINEREVLKTLVRLKTIFARAIEKRVPYIQYSEEEFLRIDSRRTFVITLTSLPYTVHGTMQEVQRSFNRAPTVIGSDFGRTLSRYLRYLQFLCLKYAIPIRLRGAYRSYFSRRQRKEIEEGIDPNTPRPLEVQNEVRIFVDLVYWWNTSFETWLSQQQTLHPSSQTLEEWIEEHGSYDVSRRVDNRYEWESSMITNGHPYETTLRTHSRYKRYWVPEKVFFYIPQILQVLRTLTRSTNYVSSAFNIRAAERPGH